MSGNARTRVVGQRGKPLRRGRKQVARFPQGRLLRFESLEVRRLLSLPPIISEVCAGNSTGIVDTLGNTADWLELYNPDPTTAANLTGWSISYQKSGGSLKTWNFPTNTILGPGEFRVVFGDSAMTSQELAAETPLGELNTGFNLSKSGATITLWDGSNGGGTSISTVAYPKLDSNTSYGPLTTVSETDLVAAGATASYYCPTSNALGTTWTQPSFNAASWATGATGLGYCNVNGFACTLYHADVSVGSLSEAETVISTPADQSSVINATENDLDFMDTGSGGHFTAYEQAFPGMTIGEGLSNYVLQATGTLTITSAQAGYYTFGVNSDDGFGLTISGADFTSLTNASNSAGSNTMQCANPRGPADTLGTTYLAAGSYPVSLVYYQDGGGASMEFYAAKETSSAGATSFDSNSILVGSSTATTASGGTSSTTTALAVSSVPFTGAVSGNSGSFSGTIATNVKSTVAAALSADNNAGTSLYTRIGFNASDLSSLTSLTLKMKYVDGYVAYLNGVEVASENAPSSPTWNSLAPAEQTSGVQADTYEDIDLSSFLNSSTTGHLTATGNVLAIQVLLNSYSETQMLVVPELAQMTSVVSQGDFIYSTPTPARPNTLADIQASLTFSQSDGLYSSSFPLTLACNVAGVPIYYTTNNAAPGVQQAVSSITYSGTTATVTTTEDFGYATGDTITIAGATPAVYDGAFVITATGANTFTYTLPSTPTANASGAGMTATSGMLYSGPIEILNSSPTTVIQAAMVVDGVATPYQTQTYIFPTAVATQPADPAGYPEVWDGTINDQDISADYGMSPVAGYTTAQIASALSSLPTLSIVTTNANMWGPSGIYSNSENHDLEVPGSLEYLNPLSGTTSWEGLAGISMYGGVGRDTQYYKHSFQIAFDQSDGPSYLNENIFGDGYLPDGLVLRGAFNDGWSWGGSSTAFIHDSWVRDTLTALGTQNTPGI